LSCTTKSPLSTKKEWKQGFLDFLVIFQKYKKVEKDIKLKE